MTEPAPAADPPKVLRLRREAWGFAVGSTLFAVGAVPWYVDAVGPAWGSATFFLGSIFFTLAAFIQLSLSGRHPPRGSMFRGADAADWWAAAIQFAGTLWFNISTGAVLIAALDPTKDFTGWRPDAWGSLAFLVSSALAVVAAVRRHELWDPLARTPHGTILNLVGSVAFGFSAVGAYVIPDTGDLYNEVWANAGTFFGALCFLAAALLARRNIATDAAG